jgi:hypothetical protein
MIKPELFFQEKLRFQDKTETRPDPDSEYATFSRGRFTYISGYPKSFALFWGKCSAQ